MARRAEREGAGDGEAAGRREAARRSAMARARELWKNLGDDRCAWLVHESKSSRALRPSSVEPGGLMARSLGAGRVCGAAELESNLERPMAGGRVGRWTAGEDDDLCRSSPFVRVIETANVLSLSQNLYQRTIAPLFGCHTSQLRLSTL